MMLIQSLNKSLFNTKVDPAPTPTVQEQPEARTLGKLETSRVLFGIQEGIFSLPGEAVPIVQALTGFPHLQAKSNGKDLLVLGNTAGAPVASIERIGDTFQIYSAQGQEPVAQVTRSGKVLHVVYEGESVPTYSIHKVVQNESKKFQTKHVIKKQGKLVASTRYGHGNSFMLACNPGTDSCLMTCLAAIADECHC